MNYVEVTFDLTLQVDFFQDILISELGEIGFESFDVLSPTEFKGYIPSNIYRPEEILSLDSVQNKSWGTVKFSVKEIENENWNSKWESQYPPVIIEGKCVVKAPFHKLDDSYEMEILIAPKMSFGTGHHSTTALMLEYIIDEQLDDKTVVDCGCGTGVLAIAACKKGAKYAKAFDIDDWSYKNSIENIKLNNFDQKIDVREGGFEQIDENEKFDVVIANINRNILTNSMNTISKSVEKSGVVFLSGFYEEDIPIVKACALDNNLNFVSFKENNRWVACKFVK